MKSEQTADAELQGLFDRVLQIAISGQESADRDALTTATPLLLSRKSRNTSLKVTFTTKVEIRFYNKDEPAKTTETEILKDMKTSSNHKLAEVPQGRKKRKCG